MISGRAGAGKDYIANAFKIALENEGKTVDVLHFADNIKDMICTLFKISRDELDIYKNSIEAFTIKVTRGNSVLHKTDFRELLQLLGTEVIKPKFGEAVWAKMTLADIQMSKADYVLIPDWRFLIESSTLQDFGLVPIKLRIENLVQKNGLFYRHPSETELRDLDSDFFDFIYCNHKGKEVDIKSLLGGIDANR